MRSAVNTPVAVIVSKDETQLRQLDRECRWTQEDGIWVLRTTRSWFRRDLDVLRPLLERMRTEGQISSKRMLPWQRKSAAHWLIWTRLKKS
jgi:hypothetical protein